MKFKFLWHFALFIFIRNDELSHLNFHKYEYIHDLLLTGDDDEFCGSVMHYNEGKKSKHEQSSDKFVSHKRWLLFNDVLKVPQTIDSESKRENE